MQKWGPAALRFVVFFVLAAPSLSFAQVVINEIMYNPQGSDSGREWVELYNEGAADVTMVGGSGKGSWRLSDGSNHTLTDPASGTGRGSLTIPAGGYLVIASDPTDFISGEYAGGSYSVVKASLSLNNNGASVTLLDGTGATVDTVSYSPSQGGNDDGSSLQRQPDGSWLAALPTPGSGNSPTPYVAPVQSNSSDESQAGEQSTAPSSGQTSGQSQQSYVPPPAPSLYADAGSDRTVIVGADVEFDGSAYDDTQTLLDPSAVRFIWNFGDGSTAEGDAVLHHFSYPGRYAVQLEVADDKNAAPAQIVVTAEPAALSFSLLPDGGVEIDDLAGHDLDLSGWIVREDAGAFAHQFIVPEGSTVLAGSSMRISPQTLSFRASSSTMFEYPNGALALAMGGSSAASSSQDAQEQQAAPVGPGPTGAAQPSPPPTAAAPLAQPPERSDADTELDDASQSDASDTGPALDAGQSDVQQLSTSTVLQTAAAASASGPTYLWWIGVAALAFAAASALVAAGYFKKGEWDIREEKPG